MIKKQIDWQMDKFEFAGDINGRQVYEQLRYQIKSMLVNGWEVESVHVLGYESTNGNAMVLVNLAKYEYVDESSLVPMKSASKVEAKDVVGSKK